jgi:site-specific recombinase XerD
MGRYLDTVRSARSEHTALTYANALHSFSTVLTAHWLKPASTPVGQLREPALGWFIAHLRRYAPATESLYLNAVMGFYTFLTAERLVDVSMPRLRLILKQRGRRPGPRLPQFPSDQIEKLLKQITTAALPNSKDPNVRLRAMRDRAFLFALADTGLRVHEACRLRRGDLDWNEGRAVIIGKGDKQAVVRFSARAMRAMRDYLAARATLDGSTGRPLPALPIFARHDKGAGAKVKPITTTTGREIVNERVKEYLGAAAEGSITPHSFRHYFVTTVLRGSGNLKLAQALARHQNIQVTQRYAHLSDDELDRGYHEIFEPRDK